MSLSYAALTELSRLAYQNDDYAEQAFVQGRFEHAAFHRGRALAYRKALRILSDAQED